jgi:two-component system cell cycle sensor histidine kinase/response regulator CckA
MLARITLPEAQRLTTNHNQDKVEQLELITSGIAHDFTNLLTSILGQSSLALNQLDDQNGARRHIEKAMKAAEYATLLARQLMSFAKNGLCDSQAICLNSLVSDNVAMLKTVFMNGIELKMELDPHLPHMVVKPGQIQQVVMNLIINAAEAIHAGHGTVTVRTGKKMLLPSGSSHDPFNGHRKLREYVYFQVNDTGTGINETELDRIFDPFFTTKPKGKGLGLSAVRDIVNEHKGEIIVESKPGQGTTITVFLPYRRRNEHPLHHVMH